MIENPAAFFYGNEYAEKMEKFDNGVREIESRNSELFEEKKLSECYLISTDKNIVGIKLETDNLPPRIVKEVLDLFESLFPKP